MEFLLIYGTIVNAHQHEVFQPDIVSRKQYFLEAIKISLVYYSHVLICKFPQNFHLFSFSLTNIKNIYLKQVKGHSYRGIFYLYFSKSM